MNIERLKKTLRRHEGVKNSIYKCSAGYHTVGIGHNLDTMPLSDRAIDLILEDDIEIATQDVKRNISFFDDLPTEVQETLVNMCFNLGITRLLMFKNMLKAIENRDWKRASEEALDSRWAKQVGDRAIELASVLEDQCYA